MMKSMVSQLVFWLVPVTLAVIAVIVGLIVFDRFQRPPLRVIDPIDLVNDWPLARFIGSKTQLERLLRQLQATTLDRGALERVTGSWQIKGPISGARLLDSRPLGSLASWRLVLDGGIQSIIVGPPAELRPVVSAGELSRLNALAGEANQAAEHGFLLLALAERRLATAVSQVPGDHRIVGAVLAEAVIDKRLAGSSTKLDPTKGAVRTLTALPITLAIELAQRLGLPTDNWLDGGELMVLLNDSPPVAEERLGQAELIGGANPAVRHLAIRSWSERYRPTFSSSHRYENGRSV